MSVFTAPIELYRILKYIGGHPVTRSRRLGAFWRFLRFQVAVRLWPQGLLYGFVGGSRLILSRNQGESGGYCYVGLPEYQEMGLVLHLLRGGDHFVDVGANIGAYTVLASAVARARTTAVEPIPSTLQRLTDNICINAIEGRVRALNVGAARKRGRLPFTTRLGSRNCCLYGSSRTVGEDLVELPVAPLDEILRGDDATVLKVDTEGFEHEVVAGASDVLRSASLQCLIIEAWNDSDLRDAILGCGFEEYDYDPADRQLTPRRTPAVGERPCMRNSAIFLRDASFAKARVSSAPLVDVFGVKL